MGFIRGFMNQALGILPFGKYKGAPGAVERERLLKAKGECLKEIISRERIVSGKAALPRGAVGVSLGLALLLTR